MALYTRIPEPKQFAKALRSHNTTQTCKEKLTNSKIKPAIDRKKHPHYESEMIKTN